MTANRSRRFRFDKPNFISNGLRNRTSIDGSAFSVSAYYGYQVGIGEGCALSMAAIALSAIFLPGFLLLAGILPFWSLVYQFPKAHAVVGGLNAAVVGLLAATLYKPIWKQSMQGLLDISIGIVGFLALRYARLPIPWLVSDHPLHSIDSPLKIRA